MVLDDRAADGQADPHPLGWGSVEGFSRAGRPAQDEVDADVLNGQADPDPRPPARLRMTRCRAGPRFLSLIASAAFSNRFMITLLQLDKPSPATNGRSSASSVRTTVRAGQRRCRTAPPLRAQLR